jgi:hypothetical protein
MRPIMRAKPFSHPSGICQRTTASPRHPPPGVPIRLMLREKENPFAGKSRNRNRSR